MWKGRGRIWRGGKCESTKIAPKCNIIIWHLETPLGSYRPVSYILRMTTNAEQAFWKFWQVAALSWTFLRATGGRAEISMGGGPRVPLEPPLFHSALLYLSAVMTLHTNKVICFCINWLLYIYLFMLWIIYVLRYSLTVKWIYIRDLWIARAQHANDQVSLLRVYHW